MHVRKSGLGFAGEGYLGIDNWFVGGWGLGYWCSIAIGSAAMPPLFCVRPSCYPFDFLPVGRVFGCLSVSPLSRFVVLWGRVTGELVSWVGDGGVFGGSWVCLVFFLNTKPTPHFFVGPFWLPFAFPPVWSAFCFKSVPSFGLAFVGACGIGVCVG